MSYNDEVARLLVEFAERLSIDGPHDDLSIPTVDAHHRLTEANETETLNDSFLWGEKGLRRPVIYR